MGKVIPILKWFFIYKENYIWTKKVDYSGDKLVLHFVEKDSTYKTGRFFDEIELEYARLECWASADLIWENKQYGFWHKVSLTTFSSLKIVDKKYEFDKEVGNMNIVTFMYSGNKTVSKFDNDSNYNKDWPKEHINLNVFYDVTSGKPIQSILYSWNLDEFYNK